MTRHARLVAMLFATAACTVLCAQNDSTAAAQVREIQEVVVTGTGTRHLLKDAPVQTEVITRAMLDTYGGKSLEDILSGLTASFAFNEGDMGSQMQLGGLSNSYILILIDGKRIHGDVGGENDLGLIDPHNIERIEIVKGAQSALYGSDAMAGVINIITRKPLLDKGSTGLYLDNTTRYGSYNDVRQHNGVGFTIGRLSSMTGFQLQHSDGWQNTAEERAEGTILTDSRNKTVNKYTNWQVTERLTYDLNKRVDLYADGMFYIKDIIRPRDGRHPSCDVYTYDLNYNNASASTGGRIALGDKPKAKADSYITWDVDWNKHAYYYHFTATTLTDGYDPNGNFTSYFPYFAGQRQLQSDQQRLMASAKAVLKLPYANLLSAGTEYRYDYLNAPMRTVNGTASDWTLAEYVQDEFTLIPWLNVTAGLRLNQNGGFGFCATPKLSAMVALGNFRLRMGWSQGFKTPTTKELYYRYLHVMGSSTFFNMGNTALKPQRSNYWSANLEYRTQRFTISATPYLNRLHDMIALINVPVSEIPPGATSSFAGDGSENVTARKYMNMESARTWGVDLNVSYTILPELTFSGNYSYLDTKAEKYDSKTERLMEVTIDGMAHHKWNAILTWQHRFAKTYKLGVSASTRGSSRRFYQNNGDGKPFQLWRIGTTHDFGPQRSKLSYRVEAGIDNLLGYCDRTIHPYHLGTSSPGRTFYATFTLRFKQGKQNNLTNKQKNIRNDEED